MAYFKLSRTVLSISLGAAALLAPVSVSAEVPVRQFEAAKAQYIQGINKGSSAEAKGGQLNADGEAPVNQSLAITDYQVSENSLRFTWENPNFDQNNFYQILIDGQEAAVVEDSFDDFNYYTIQKILQPNTEYRLTIKVMRNGVLIGEETSLTFKTLEAPSGEAVSLKDPNLAQAIKEQLVIVDRKLFESDFPHLTELTAGYRQITSIEGLERAVQLEGLDLRHNSIDDIGPLAGLSKLKRLFISANPLKSIDVLTSLESLEMVDLRETPIHFSKGSAAMDVVTKLNSKGVFVEYDLLSVYKKIQSDKAVGIAWISNNDTKPDYYKVYYNEIASGEDVVEVTTTTPNILLTGLKPGSSYFLYIASYKNGKILDEAPGMFDTFYEPALNGWVQLGDNWYFYNKSKEQLAKGWLDSGSNWYYMDQNGVMKTGWVQSNGKWYFMDETGAMETGWVKSAGKWYYLNDNGGMATGWVKTGGAWYYLESSGAMKTGWVLTAGKWYYLKDNGKMAYNTTIGSYKLGPDGAWVK